VPSSGFSSIDRRLEVLERRPADFEEIVRQREAAGGAQSDGPSILAELAHERDSQRDNARVAERFSALLKKSALLAEGKLWNVEPPRAKATPARSAVFDEGRTWMDDRIAELDRGGPPPRQQSRQSSVDEAIRTLVQEVERGSGRSRGSR